MISLLFHFILCRFKTIKQALLLYGLLTIMAGITYADEAADTNPVSIEDIYRIEIIIFANRFSQSEEKWTLPTTLSYPEDLIFLNQTIEAPQDSLANPSDAAYSNNNSLLSDATLTPLIQTSNVALTDAAPNKNLADPQATAPTKLLPELLTKLKSNDFTLQDSSKRLQRRAAYKVLFHEAWYQALDERQSAASIPLHGGLQYDNHFQLEGSVKFSKNRFLHITTNLWLSDFSPLATENGYSPWYQDIVESIDLPAIPTPPVVEQNFILPSNTELNDTNDALPSIEEELAANNLASTMIETANKIYHYGNEIAFDSNENPTQALTQEGLEPSTQQQPEYAASKVYLLKEYRRIKRDEVHYLDHPKFGVIVTINKYEPKQSKKEDLQ